MKTGPSKLYRKLALNRRSNRINHTVYGSAPSNEIPVIENPFKAVTITASNRIELAEFSQAMVEGTDHRTSLKEVLAAPI